MIKEKYINVFTVAIVASLILITARVLIAPMMNPDGTVYLQAAYAFNTEGFHAALQVYSWPLYSILIALIHKTTTLSYLHATYVLNALAQAMIAVAFVAIIKELGGNKRTLWFGLFTILGFHFLNAYRTEIIRDFAYWGFSLTSLWCLLRFSKTHAIKYALGWNASIIIATLFRIEGFAFLLFAPLVLLVNQDLSAKQRLLDFIKANAINIMGLIALMIVVLGFAQQNLADQLGRAGEITNQLQSGLVTVIANFVTKRQALAQYVLPDAATHTSLMLISGLIVLYLKWLFITLGMFFVGLTIYAIKQKLLPTDSFSRKIIHLFIVINVCVTVLFLAQDFFLVNRYVAYLAMVLMVWVPFALERIYLNWQARCTSFTGKHWFYPTLILLMSVSMLSVMGNGRSQNYIVRAGAWYQQHLVRNARVFTNNNRALFYATPDPEIFYTDSGTVSQLSKNNVKQYHYLFLQFDHRRSSEMAMDKQILAKLDIKLIKTFSNKRNDQIDIYRVINRAKSSVWVWKTLNRLINDV